MHPREPTVAEILRQREVLCNRIGIGERAHAHHRCMQHCTREAQSSTQCVQNRMRRASSTRAYFACILCTQRHVAKRDNKCDCDMAKVRDALAMVNSTMLSYFSLFLSLHINSFKHFTLQHALLPREGEARPSGDNLRHQHHSYHEDESDEGNTSHANEGSRTYIRRITHFNMYKVLSSYIRISRPSDEHHQHPRVGHFETHLFGFVFSRSIQNHIVL